MVLTKRKFSLRRDILIVGETNLANYGNSYWDLPYDNFKNSYVDVAVDAYGFCTLAIDRFGVGNSTVANPLNIVQTPVTLSTIYEITKMLRTGKIPFIPHPFKKVVHVGTCILELSYALG